MYNESMQAVKYDLHYLSSIPYYLFSIKPSFGI